MDRHGLGWEAMHALNPRLLYVSVSGFGQEGPYTARPCSDSVAQAFSGLVSVNIGNDGTPHRLGAIIIDTLTGLYSAQTLGTALFQRERTGEGRWLDLNLTACGAAILGHKLAEHLLEGGAPRALNTPAGVYRTRDGWIMITLVRESHFHALARGVGRPELAQDPRYATFATRADHAAGLYALLREILAGDTSAHWLERLTKEDVLVERIYGFDEWLADPHVQAIGGAVAIEQPGMGRIRTPRTPGVAAAIDAAMPPSPAVGEHGRAVLAELRFTAGDIERLAERGILHLARKAA
jgi:crotonobetainyl-CoA:carnitine CoA-transferase CaiB-like acyl-CoA transferase